MEPDEMDSLKYKVEYYLYKHFSRKQNNVDSKENNRKMKDISENVKEYTNHFLDDTFKFRHLDHLKNIIDNKDYVDEKRRINIYISRRS